VSTVLTTLRDAVLDGFALLLPVECAGCGAPDRAVCARCRPTLAPDPSSRLLADGTRVFSAFDYDGVARAVILAFKEQGRTELARALAPALAAAVVAAAAEPVRVSTVGRAGGGAVELVTVPGSRRSRRRRGFDPVASLVSRAGLDHARVFAPARPRVAQKTLNLEQRSANLEGVFAVRVPVEGRRFLLVDDVVTTGATLMAAVDALRSGGAEVVSAAVLASTPKLFGGSFGPHRERSATFP
jgi:ComF family protein